MTRRTTRSAGRAALAAAAALALGLPAVSTAQAAGPSPAEPAAAPASSTPAGDGSTDRSDSMPPLAEQQRADLLGPGARQAPARAGEPAPRASTTSPLATAEGGHSDANTAYGCRGYSSIPKTNPAAQVRRDVFAWGAYRPYRVGDGTGDIDWKANPYRQVTWYMWLHSLRWLGSLITAGEAGDRDALAHASAIASDWARDNPYSWQANAGAWESTMHRTNVLLCLRQAIAKQNGGTRPASAAWLDQSLLEHAEFMKRHYSGWGNHGTDESIAMLGVGCTLRRDAYRDLATARLGQAIVRAIDSQGATNEQSTAYAHFNHGLWGAAQDKLTACAPGSPAVRTVRVRRARLAEFLAHASTPLGFLHQIGNTEQKAIPALRGTPQEWPATRGASGRPPVARGRVYAAGYVFGRTGWGNARIPYARESGYALRFGPARALHGHSDGTSLAWQARGRDILRDTGFGEYTRDAWQAYAKSPAAHNQLVVSGMSERVATRLVRSSFAQVRGPAGAPAKIADSFRLADSPAPGVTRVRDVIVIANPDVVLVADRATSRANRSFSQQWHLPADRKVKASSRGTYLAAVGAGVTTTLLQLPHHRVAVPGGSARVRTGSTAPIAGWFWPDIFTKRPAPTVSLTRSGRSAAMVTAIAASAPNDRVTATVAPGRRGATTYTVTVGGASAQVSLGAKGWWTRLR